jgi:hypothetical protein
MLTEVREADHGSDPSYSVALWVGTIGGSALPTDPDPNVTPPNPNRIFRWTSRRNTLMCMGAGPPNGAVSQVVVVGGTNIDVQLWFYDDTQAKWVKAGGHQILTSATSNVGSGLGFVVMQNFAGAKTFFQVIANNGVQAFGVDIR